MHTSNSRGLLYELYQNPFKGNGVFQWIPVGFGAGQYLGRLVLGLHHMTRPEPMALSSNCRNTTLVKAVLVVLHWPILSNLAKLDQQYSHPFRIKKGYFFNILSNFQTLNTSRMVIPKLSARHSFIFITLGSNQDKVPNSPNYVHI